MAENNVVTGDWNYTEDQIDRETSLNLSRIQKNSTIGQMIDTLNANFESIARHGGGPAGIDGRDGLKGIDGTNVEYVYALCDANPMIADVHYPSTDNGKDGIFRAAKNGEKATYKGVEWYNHALPISIDHKNEYVMARFSRGKKEEEGEVTLLYGYSDPVLWAHWGETGMDGDGVEYIFMTSTRQLTNNELYNSIKRKGSFDDFQNVIFNFDGFYPGPGWFNSTNKVKSLKAIRNAGLQISDSTFETRWSNYFDFCENTEWSDNPTGTNHSIPYEYVSMRRSNSDENDKKVWSDFSTPTLWSNYSLSSRTFIIYCNTDYDSTPEAPETGKGWWDIDNDILIFDKPGYELPEGWADTNVDEPGKLTWMCSGMFDHTGRNTHWSAPMRATGIDGKNGEDGSLIQFIYTLSKDMPDYPVSGDETTPKDLFDLVEEFGEFQFENTVWHDRALSVSQSQPIEWVWSRQRKSESDVWTFSEEPIVWAHYGEDGTDGDGIEYIFAVTLINNSRYLSIPTYETLDEYQKKIFQIDDFVPSESWFNDTNKAKAQAALGADFSPVRWSECYDFNHYSDWSDNPIPVDVKHPYQWVSVRKSNNDAEGNAIWGNFSEPVLWNSYGQEHRNFILYCNMPNENTPNSIETGKGWWLNTGGVDKLLLTEKDFQDANWEGDYSSYVVNYAFGDPSDPESLPTQEQITNHIGIWSDKNIDVVNTITWMISGTFSENGENVSWCSPFRITGDKGRPGADGTTIEFVYTITDSAPTVVTDYPEPTNQHYSEVCLFFENIENAKYKDTLDPTEFDVNNMHIDERGIAYYQLPGSELKWYDNPQGIRNEQGFRTEWVWSRNKTAGDSAEIADWVFAQKPVIWSHWGEDGTDGDGVEYIFVITQSDSNLGIKLPTYSSLNDEQKKLFQIDDFVPSSYWFTNEDRRDTNKAKAEEVLEREIGNAEWNGCFGFNTYSAWEDNPVTVDVNHPYQWVSIRKSHNDAQGNRIWDDFCEPTLWSSYGKISRTFMVYCNMPDETTPNKLQDGDGVWDVGNNSLDLTGVDEAITDVTSEQRAAHIGVWSDTNIDVANTITWLASGIFTEDGANVLWSEPFRITGAQGRPGADGTNIEFVYALSDTEPASPKNGTDVQKNSFFESVEIAGSTGHPYDSSRWFDNPQGIANEDGKRTEWVWSRSKPAGEGLSTAWTYAVKPIKWSHWGEDGTDGDGVEYIFITKQTESYTGVDISTGTWSNYWTFSNDTARAIYSMDDFVPNSSWFSNENKTAVQTKMTADEKTFVEEDWTTVKNQLSPLGWNDNPQSISTTNKYQYVSVRKSIDGVWGPFSYPTLWAKYSLTSFKSFAFTCTTIYEDISNLQPTGGSFATPKPDQTTSGSKSYTWHDGPTTEVGKPLVWMTSATFNEQNGLVGTWSKPKKMTDASEFQVEWSSDDLTGDALATKISQLGSSTYNFERFLSTNEYDEDAAEEAWENEVYTNLGLTFSDSSENAILMATCQFNNGEWSNWDLVRVKGETGETGTSLKVTGSISYELDFGSNSYTKSSVTTFFNNNITSTATSPREDEIAIVYPHDMTVNDTYYGDSSNGGALYMWRYKNSQWNDYNDYRSNGEEAGNTYISPNGHLILWNGDFWKDMGNIVGPEGKSYKILIKYADDDFTHEPSHKKYASDPTSAKWIGTLTYTEGVDNPSSITVDDSRWQWSLFRGQDGFGYEYIFKTTNSDSPAPSVPSTTPTQDNQPNAEPGDWVDEPMDPTSTSKYVWMCWRRYDHSTGSWSKFMGKDNKTAEQSGVAKLWSIYNNSVDVVEEYYHADTSKTPQDTTKYNGTPSDYPTYWYTNINSTGWSSNTPYLFNVEVVKYTNKPNQKGDPHFISAWERGLLDITEYYCLGQSETDAPAMSGGDPVISGGIEGTTRWTTDASKTKISESYKFLWNVGRKQYADGRLIWGDPHVIGVYNKGVKGDSGNGYQYKYVRYKTTYSTTTCTISNTSSDTPTFKFGSTDVTSTATNSPQGVNATYTYEFRSERFGNSDDGWSVWSTPVIIGKYLDAENITETVNDAIDNKKAEISSYVQNDISSTLTDVSTLKGKFDSNGKLKDGFISDDAINGIVNGYLETDDLGTEVVNFLVGGTSITKDGQTKTFSQWIDYKSGAISSLNTSYDALNGQIKTINNSLFGKDTSTASDVYTTDAKEHFASIDRSVANLTYLTDTDGYLLADITYEKGLYVTSFTTAFIGSWEDSDNDIKTLPNAFKAFLDDCIRIPDSFVRKDGEPIDFYTYVRKVTYSSNTRYLWKNVTHGGYIILNTDTATTANVNTLKSRTVEKDYNNIFIVSDSTQGTVNKTIEAFFSSVNDSVITSTATAPTLITSGTSKNCTLDTNNTTKLTTTCLLKYITNHAIRRRALKSDGTTPAKLVTEVREADLDYLVTTVEEMATISQSVSKGIACTSIIATVPDGNGGEVSAGQVFAATPDGSYISLMADKVGIKSKHFNLDESGISMEGNLLAKDTKGTVTAGVIGADHDSDPTDVKFFAGTTREMTDIDSAPFRVLEDGSLYATSAHISGEITLHPEYHFNNGYYQEDYTGTIHFGEQGLNMNAADVNLGYYAFIHGFKEHITFFDPLAHYKRTGTKISNTYDDTLDDDFIICGNVYDVDGRPASQNPYTYGNLTVRLYVPEYYKNGVWTRSEPSPMYRVLKILATSSSVVITNSKMACKNGESTPRIKMSKTRIVQNHNVEVDGYYSFSGVDSVTITAGQMAYVYTLDNSPESDDPEHLGWFVRIVG